MAELAGWGGDGGSSSLTTIVVIEDARRVSTDDLGGGRWAGGLKGDGGGRRCGQETGLEGRGDGWERGGSV